MHVRSRIRHVRTGCYHLSGLEDHLAGGIAHRHDLTLGLDVVSCIYGSHELDIVIRLEQAFVSVIDDKQLSRHVSEKLEHLGSVHKIAAVVCVMAAHTHSDK